jgi:hypothetical protein
LWWVNEFLFSNKGCFYRQDTESSCCIEILTASHTSSRNVRNLEVVFGFKQEACGISFSVLGRADIL